MIRLALALYRAVPGAPAAGIALAALGLLLAGCSEPMPATELNVSDCREE